MSEDSESPRYIRERDEIADAFNAWSEQLTNRSFELSLGVLAGNWVLHGNAGAIGGNVFAALSVCLVLVGMLVFLVGTFFVSELNFRRYFKAEQDLKSWKRESDANVGKASSWPFTDLIQGLSTFLRWAKMLIPLVAGVLLIIGAFRPTLAVTSSATLPAVPSEALPP